MATNGTGPDNQGGTQPPAGEGDPAEHGNAGGQTPAVKTYTQEEVNRIVAERSAKARRTAEKEVEAATAGAIAAWREEQGLSDEVLDKLRKGESEHVQKLRAVSKEKADLEKAHKALQDRYDRAHGILVEERTKTAILSEAAKLSHDPESVYLHLRTRLRVEEDYSTTVLGEDGEPAHGRAVSDLVTELLERKPHLKIPEGSAGGGARGGKGNGRPGQPDMKTREGRIAALRKIEWSED